MKEPLKFIDYSKESLEFLFDEAICFAQTNDLSTPAERQLSMAFYNDAPGGIGGGTRAIYWFENEKALLECISNYLLILNQGPSGMDYTECIKSISKTIDKFYHSKVSREAAISNINKIAKGSFQIEWWGTREKLLFGDESFPKWLRSWWRGQGKRASAAPVKMEELDKFLEYLESGYSV